MARKFLVALRLAGEPPKIREPGVLAQGFLPWISSTSHAPGHFRIDGIGYSIATKSQAWDSSELRGSWGEGAIMDLMQLGSVSRV